MKKYNVCYFLGSLNGGGAENMVFQILKYIDKNKFNPIVCVFTKSGILRNEFESLGIPIYEFPVNNYFRAGIEYIKFIYFLVSKKIDVIHVNLVGTFIFSMTAAYLAGIKIRILHWQNAYELNRTEKVKNVKYGNLIATKIVAISQYVKNRNCEIYNINESKVVTIYNAIDFENVRSIEMKEKEMIIGTTAKMTRQKGYDTLLKAFSIVIKENPELKLEIIGTGVLEKEIKLLIQDLKLSKNVVLVGQKDNNTVKEIMKNWKIFILASNWEGFGIVLVEAMSLGLPIIASHVEAIPEIVVNGKTGLTFNKEDYSELASLITYLIKDEKLQNRLGEIGLIRAKEKFNIQYLITNFELLYQEA